MTKTTNKTKTMIFLLSIVMIVNILAMIVSFGTIETSAVADDITVTIDTGESITLKDSDKNGTLDIKTADELYAYAAFINSKNYIDYIEIELLADVTVNANLMDKLIISEDGSATPIEGANLRLWTPISHESSTAHISFNGNGYEIYGLYCNENNDGVGFFGKLGSSDCQIGNLGILDSYFSGKNNVGAIIGYAVNQNIVYNCYTNAIVKGSENMVGGIAGELRNGAEVNKCYFAGTVYGVKYVGGIAGYVYTMNYIGGVIDSYSVGDVYGTDYVGGIAGFVTQSASRIADCYNYGSVYFENGKYGGAICGNVANTNRVSSCYNMGTVVAKKQVGGISGAARNGYIINCYSIGEINGDTAIGGIVGRYYRSSILNCYYLVGTTEGGIADENITGQAEVKSQEAFASGEVAYLLGSAFGQEIGKDAYPVLGGKAVYFGYISCSADAVKVYSNAKASDEILPHEDEDKNHVCDNGCKMEMNMDKHVDADGDHVCDYGCDEAIGEHADKDGDGKCDVCKGEIPKEPASENDGDSYNSEASDSSADAQTSEQTANGKKKGCRSTVIGASVCVLVLTTIVGSSMIRKKKEN